jgi:hypothetical protein
LNAGCPFSLWEKKRNKMFSKEMAQPFFGEEWLTSPKLNGQLAFNFDQVTDMLWIYCMKLRSLHLNVEWVHERYNSPKKRPIGVVSTTYGHFHRLRGLADVEHEISVYTCSVWYCLLGGGEQSGYFFSRISPSKEDITGHQWKCGSGSDVRVCLLPVDNSRLHKINVE